MPNRFTIIDKIPTHIIPVDGDLYALSHHCVKFPVRTSTVLLPVRTEIVSANGNVNTDYSLCNRLAKQQLRHQDSPWE